LNSYFLPTQKASVLATKKSLLVQAYKAYCSGISGCGVPSPDKVPVQMQTVSSSIIGTQSVKCPPGLSLLSCGIQNRPG